MESTVTETFDCHHGLTDFGLLKSGKQLSLESSHSHTSSDYSEPSDEETEIQNDKLIEQFNNLSFEDVQQSKCITSECLNKISETNNYEKDNNGKLKFVENKEIEENRFSSSVVKNKKLSNFVEECKCSNKSCEINSKKNNTEELIFVENLEDVENQLSSLSLKNDKLSKKCNKRSDSGISVGDESDSYDEQVEPVILRERDPTRHSRREQRTTPFSRNHANTSRFHFHSGNSQTFGNFSPDIFYDYNTSHDACNSLSHTNSTDFESYGIVFPSNKTFHSAVPTSDSVTNEAFESMVSSIMTDEIFNNVIPYTAAHQIVNNVVPCTVTDQIVDGVNPCTITNQIVDDIVPCTVTDQIVDDIVRCTMTDQIVDDIVRCTMTDQIVDDIVRCTVSDQIVDGVVSYAALDGIVPYTDNIENSNDKFFEEINDIPCFDNLKERISLGCEVPNLEKEILLDPCFEDITLEVENIIKSFTGSTLDNVSSPNKVDFVEDNPLDLLSSKEAEQVSNNSDILYQNTHAVSTVEEFNYPYNDRHSLHQEPDYGHNSTSDLEKTLLFSNFGNENDILRKSGQYYNSEDLVNKPGSYSNLVCKNITSINCESSSPKTSDYKIISNEIEHEIVKWKEMKEWVNKREKKQSEGLREISWNIFPFDEVDDNANSDCTNIPENKISKGRNDSKTKNINQTYKPKCKTEKIKIRWMLGTAARDKLFNDSSFDQRKWERESEEIIQQIKSGKLGTDEKKVINVLKKVRSTKYRGTNLHNAIISENIEKVFCIVEWHKECHDGISEINLRDSFNKTVLDYSKEKGMDLLSEYLEENTAKVSINVQ